MSNACGSSEPSVQGVTKRARAAKFLPSLSIPGKNIVASSSGPKAARLQKIGVAKRLGYDNGHG